MGDRVARWHEEEKRLRELVRTLQGAREVLARLGQAGQRDGVALEALGRRGAAARARRRPARSSVRLRGARLGPPRRRRCAASAIARPRAPLLRRGPLRRARRAHRPQRLGQDAPHAAARRRGRRRTRARSCSATASRPGCSPSSTPATDFAGARRARRRDARVPARGSRAMAALARYGLQDAAPRTYETLSGGQQARLEILCARGRGPQPAAARRAHGQPRHRRPPRRSRRRWTASRARSSRSPTTARS